jgi:hypothetical protein
MNFDDARAAIYGRLDTAWGASHPTMPVRYENRMAVDLDKEKSPFVACELLFTDGEQIELSANPGTRYQAAIYLSAWAKEDSGTSDSLKDLSELALLFGMKSFGGVNTRAARPLPGRVESGWYVLTLRVPFWIDVF